MKIIGSKEDIYRFLVAVVARYTDVPEAAIRIDEALERYGVDSLHWADIAYEISAWAGRHISPEAAADCVTVEGLAAFLLCGQGVAVDGEPA